MSKVIIGNFKMNTGLADVEKYLDTFLPKAKETKAKVGLAMPFTHLYFANQKLVSTDVMLGAQNAFYENSGAYTGEVSPAMLKEFGASFVILGHSERRKYFGEKDAIVNKKILKCLEHNLKIVLCIGEKDTERKAGKTNAVLKQQVELALKNVYENELKNITIAYEPVWAIGSGKIPTLKEIEETVANIREVVKNSFSEKAAKAINILYGGSANLTNYLSILRCKGVDGLLVGGACLKPDEFSKMVNMK